MITKVARINNSMGIHVRPSGLIITETQTYSGNITLKSKGIEVLLRSIMDLLALGLSQGDEVEISISGPDEESYSTKLKDLFEFDFDFLPR